MSEYLDSYNSVVPVDGWYYDLQQENPLTSVTLHANRKLSNPESSEKSEYSWTDWNDDDKKEYGKTPICRAILNEDFSVTTANVWSEIGGDPIGNFWREAVQPFAAYLPFVQKELGRLGENIAAEAERNSSTLGGKAANFLNTTVGGGLKFMERIGQKFSQITDGKSVNDYLRSALIVQGTRFTYYGGTGISFQNLGMRFTVFPTWENGKFKSVNEQIKELWPYLIGELVKDKLINDEDLKDFIMWQRPPGDFYPDLKDVDKVLKGTLKLQFGPHYAIKNLVCDNATLNFSKQMVKQPDGDQLKISPLYCDVNIILRPAGKYSDKKLKEFISGDNQVKKDVEKNINSNLSSIKSGLEGTYNK